MKNNKSTKQIVTFCISMILDCIILLYALAFSPVGMTIRGIAAGIILAAMIAEVISYRKNSGEELGKDAQPTFAQKKIA